MFEIWLKGTLALIVGLSFGGARQTHKKIKKGEIQWVAWKGKHDSIFFAKEKEQQLQK